MFEANASAESFDRGAELHALLVRRAHATDAQHPDEVMNLVAAVVIHGLFEQIAVARRAGLVSEELRESLAAEHAALVDTLGLMEELAADPAEVDDLRALCSEVHEKILRHVERDARVLYGSLARLSANSPLETD